MMAINSTNWLGLHDFRWLPVSTHVRMRNAWQRSYGLNSARGYESDFFTHFQPDLLIWFLSHKLNFWLTKNFLELQKRDEKKKSF